MTLYLPPGGRLVKGGAPMYLECLKWPLFLFPLPKLMNCSAYMLGSSPIPFR
eukprot:CAMPEP_0168616862 /NCGR_PEP_ID=MMETSP0449_2-20121227/5247_1 /TAXON_ID=1082188 /ORGANISM="Strombidium rassoulzadegani, Strain ras09" /LENGTH=51 /DNA_ID=CAMNT_0008657663 /DNA_START=816 /DNA_END=971 /DNA_ORIENTATION=+